MKTKHQLSLYFSLYFFCFLIVFFLLFLLIFKIVFDYQIKRDLNHEIIEIIPRYLLTEKGIISFKRDEEGETLRQHLFNDGISAMFTDVNFQILRKYGDFELKNVKEKESLKELKSLADQSAKTNKITESHIRWHDHPLVVYSIPLKSQNNIVGTMFLAKPTDSSARIIQTLIIVLTVLGLIGLGGSLILTRFLLDRSFAPLIGIIQVIEDIDLEKLDKVAKITGHPDDELVLLAKKFNTMVGRLKDMAQKQKEFVANASHELKTPLARAVSSLDLIISQKNFDEKELRLIKADLLDINSLIEKLLVISRLSQNFLPPRGNTHLMKMFQKITADFAGLLNTNQLQIGINIPEKFTLPVPEEYAFIIFNNLLSNAIKFSFPKTVIRIHAYQKGNQKIVEVVNQGIGVEKGEAEKIFDRFYRGQKAKNIGHGHGIGLAIVKQLCDLYHITIRLIPEKNQITRVELNSSSSLLHTSTV